MISSLQMINPNLGISTGEFALSKEIVQVVQETIEPLMPVITPVLNKLSHLSSQAWLELSPYLPKGDPNPDSNNIIPVLIGGGILTLVTGGLLIHNEYSLRQRESMDPQQAVNELSNGALTGKMELSGKMTGNNQAGNFSAVLHERRDGTSVVIYGQTDFDGKVISAQKKVVNTQEYWHTPLE